MTYSRFGVAHDVSQILAFAWPVTYFAQLNISLIASVTVHLSHLDIADDILENTNIYTAYV